LKRFLALTLLCPVFFAADIELIWNNLDGWKLKGDAKKSKWKIGLAKQNKFHPEVLNANPRHGDHGAVAFRKIRLQPK
jgi:hypothetical protein